MKKTLFYLLLLCSLSPLYSQNADVSTKIKKSVVFKDEYTYSTIVSVDEDDKGGVVVLRSYRGGVFSGNKIKGYYIEHYDANMKLIKDYEYEFDKKGNPLGAFLKDNKVHVVNFEYKKDIKAYVCNVSIADIDTFKFADTELFRVDKKEMEAANGGVIYVSGDGFARMLINDDKTAFSISLNMEDKKDKRDMRKILIYDNSLNLKFEKIFKSSVKDRKFEFQNLDVSADGTVVYLLGKAATDAAKDKKDGSKFQYELTRLTSTDVKTKSIGTGEHYISSLKAIIKKDRIACVGFYSDKSDDHFKGLCYFNMDPITLDIKTTKYNAFTEQFMIDKYGEKRADKKKEKDEEIKNIDFNDFFVTEDNEIIFNGEEYYVTMHQREKSTIFYYHYDDIITAKIAQDGSLVWIRNINKQQSSTDMMYNHASYLSFIKEGVLYFLINSDETPKILDDGRPVFGRSGKKEANLNILKVNIATGDYNYKQLMGYKESEVTFMVAEGEYFKSSGTIYLLGRLKSKKRIVKVKME